MKKMGGLLAVMMMAAPVFASLSAETPEDAVASIEAMVQKKTVSKAGIAELVQALKSPDSSIRVKERAAWALGELDAKSAAPALLEACNHKGLLVRSAALNALMRLRPATALPAFITISEQDPILSLRQRATLGLGLLQNDKAIQPLVKLSSDPAPEVKGAAALAMASLQSKKNDFTEALKDMLTDPNPYVQENAKRGLEAAQRKNALVLEQLEASDADVRLFAALYFYQHGTSKELKALKAAANGDADEDVRAQLQKTVKAVTKRAAAKPKPAAGKKPAAAGSPKTKPKKS